MNRLGVNWFDLVMMAVVVVGVMVGRRRGMSLELLDLIQWLLVVVVAGFTYSRISAGLVNVMGFGMVMACITAYLLVAIAIVGIFAVVKRFAGEKLLGSDAFGVFEYYLGMLAGGMRFLLISVFVLAVFNAPQVTDQELARQLKTQNEDLGAIYFPPFGSIQRSVFDGSFSGRLVRDNLSAQLIHVAPIEGGKGRDTVWRQRERDVNAVIGGGK
jgi:uncharacterized membrane protein required for colicin V production